MFETQSEGTDRPYGRMVPECRKRGIGRSKAYELEATGLIETFSIGRGKFVYLDSLASLPARVANSNVQRHAA